MAVEQGLSLSGPKDAWVDLAGGYISGLNPNAGLASSNAAAAAANTLTILGVAGQTIWVLAIYVFTSVSTAAVQYDMTVTGLKGGTVTIPMLMKVATGAFTNTQDCSMSFPAPVPSIAPDTNVVVSIPAEAGGAETTIIVNYIQQ